AVCLHSSPTRRSSDLVPGSARQGVVYNIDSTDPDLIHIAAFRDFVQSPYASWGYVRATATPQVSITGTTSSSITVRVLEQYGYRSEEHTSELQSRVDL